VKPTAKPSDYSTGLTSVLPIMVSGNLSGPVSALAWRAADFIVECA
jgi:choline dehydrogenase-like flavoprotein